MHDSAEKFDPRTETVFKVLQVISACAMSFAHGANDVANSIGSFCAAFYVYQNMAVPSGDSEVRAWVVATHLSRRVSICKHHAESGSCPYVVLIAAAESSTHLQRQWPCAGSLWDVPTNSKSLC